MFNDVPLVTSIQEYNDASSSLTHTHTLYSSGLTMISLKICCFPRFLRSVSDGPTDRQMDGRTDRWTHPLIEMRGRIWKAIFHIAEIFKLLPGCTLVTLNLLLFMMDLSRNTTLIISNKQVPRGTTMRPRHKHTHTHTHGHTWTCPLIEMRGRT